LRELDEFETISVLLLELLTRSAEELEEFKTITSPLLDDTRLELDFTELLELSTRLTEELEVVFSLLLDPMLLELKLVPVRLSALPRIQRLGCQSSSP
jgi:hypothetical protein